MELKDFASEAFTQIAEGAHEAKDKGPEINPRPKGGTILGQHAIAPIRNQTAD